MRKSSITCSSFLVLALAWLFSFDAHATTPSPGWGEFRVCLKADMTGLVDRTTGDRATASTWTLYGINYRVESGGSVVQNWTYADANDGCFLLDAGVADYTIKVKPRSTALDGNNTVRVNNSAGSLKTYAVTASNIGTSYLTYEVTLPSKALLRIYTVLAFSIERAFRGEYEDADLTAWKDPNSSQPCECSPDPCTKMCSNGSSPQISIAHDHHARKFIIAHEYGHATMNIANVGGANDCLSESIDDQGGDGHYLRGRERSSCAATEGFAHFVAGDVFNWHNAGTGSANPQAELKYVDDGVWNLGSGSGGCPTYPINAVSATNNPLKLYIDCASGVDDPSIGIEMDWARLWWDYHEDSNKPSSPRGHTQLHGDIGAGGLWGSDDAYETVLGGLSSGLANRFDNAAEWNGVCEGSSC